MLEHIEEKLKNYQEEGDQETKERLQQITAILKGEIRDRLYLQFLKKNNHTDVSIISTIKKVIGPKSSILHGATVWANSMMNAYTTNDTFLKDNLQWVSQATNWNRFNATASLGIIHSGNKKDALEVLNPYFHGSAETPSSPYSCAGAYFAYGLIHQNQCSQEIVNYFIDGYRNSGQSEPVQHGISLGLGLVGMATKNPDIFTELKQVLYNNADSAIIGEAAAYGMGLVMIGASDQESI
jgi:26S proteasome regulatory subunit N2